MEHESAPVNGGARGQVRRRPSAVRSLRLKRDSPDLDWHQPFRRRGAEPAPQLCIREVEERIAVDRSSGGVLDPGSVGLEDLHALGSSGSQVCDDLGNAANNLKTKYSACGTFGGDPFNKDQCVE